MVHALIAALVLLSLLPSVLRAEEGAASVPASTSTVAVASSPPASQPPEVRERMAELLLLPKEKLWKELSKWPSFKRMTLDEQSAFLARLAAAKRQAQKKALDHAVKIGLAIPPEKHEAFTDDYLRERLRLHRKFVAEKRKGDAPSPEAFDREFDRRLVKKYGPAQAQPTPPPPGSGTPPPSPSPVPSTGAGTS